ncbi:MAG TPA: response regulator, partial [Opitutales bacterium]|nr:response regulator [Opitutales bacterium]
MPTQTILLVDDDPQFNQLLADIFADTTYELVTANDPKKALELLKSTQIQLVITDYKMPGLNGIAFMEAARTIRPQLIFIMISAFLDTATARELINAGIGGVFTKPLNVFALLKCAVSLLEEHTSSQPPTQLHNAPALKANMHPTSPRRMKPTRESDA